MAEKRDYYEILGVTKSASADELKRAYRKLALEWHPDRNKSPEANDRFKEINEAYAVLSDPKKKETYDQFGADAFRPGAGQTGGGQGPWGSGFDQGPFSYYYSSGGQGGASPFGSNFVDPFEIFEQFFGGGFSPRQSRAPRREVYEITLDFMDAVHGATREVHIPKGKAGDGTIRKTIKIPAGVETGSRIRFDTFDIVCDVKPDPKFKREGDDLIIEMPISFSEAALGTVLDVATIDGSLKIRVQPGTQSGTLIRLRGKGVPHIHGGGRGDEYVKLTISVPNRLSRRQKELFEALSKEGI